MATTPDLKKFIKEEGDKTRRHFDVVAEDLKSQIAGVSEQVATNTEKLTKHGQRFDAIDENLETIKLDIELIKYELKQKVSHKEFAILEKRVSRLESKFRTRR